MRGKPKLSFRNVLFLGDSITKGQYLDPSQSWVARCQRDPELRASGFHFYSSAVSGETSTRVLERLVSELESFPLEYCFVQLGLNDANFWKSEGGSHPRTSPSRFRENLKEMVERAELSGVGQVLLSTSHKVLKQIDSPGTSFGQHLGIYNGIIRDVARRFGLEVFDLDLVCDNDFSPEYLLPAPDLLHLSVAGHLWYFNHLKSSY